MSVCSSGDSAVTVTFSDTCPTCSFASKRARSPADNATGVVCAGEALQLDLHGVGADRQQVEDVVAGLVGRRAADVVRADVLDGDGHAGQDGAGGVGDAADDVGGGDLGGHAGRDQDEEQSEPDDGGTAAGSRHVRLPSRSLLGRDSRNRLHRICNRLQGSRILAGTPARRKGYDRGRVPQHLRSRQTRRRLDRDGLARPEPARASCRPPRAARCMQAVERLGYAPNAAAKNLRTLRTGKLLVTVPDISNPFFSLILQGIEDAAQREGYSVLLGDTQHDERARGALRADAEAEGGRRPDLPRPPAAEGSRRAGARRWRRAARRSSTAASSARRLGIPSVHIDNAKAASEAMDHLYRLGHRRIGIVTGPLVSPLSRDRLTRRDRAREDSSAPSATSSS